MNANSIFQSAFILQTSSSALESPARKALENAANSDFFWLLISTGFVAVGIAFEYPEVKHEFAEWVRSRKKSWIVDPGPTNRNRIPLWSLIGFLIVTAGVAGEGIYEGLLGINDTKIRRMDEASLAGDELQIAKLQKDNLTLQKQAGDAATSAHNAAVDAKNAKGDAGDAKALASGARKEADTFAGDIRTANENAASALRDKAEALKQTAAAQAELIRIRSPRSLANRDKLVADIKPFNGTEYILNVSLDQESNEFIRPIAAALDAAGWIRKQPAGMNIGIPTMKIDFGHGPEFVPSCIESGIGINVKTKQSLSLLRATPIPQLPTKIRAGLTLRESLLASIMPADDHSVDAGVVDPDPGEDVLPIRICVGQKPLTIK